MKRIMTTIAALVLAAVFLTGGTGRLPAAQAEGSLTDRGFEYSLLEDGTAEITGYTGTARKVSIPERAGGRQVTAIASFAFGRNRDMTAVIIPEGVRQIGAYAFSDCASLHSVQLPESLKEIGDGAFENCAGISGLVLPEGIETIGENPFRGCSALASLRFSGGNAGYEVSGGLLYHRETATIVSCAPKALNQRLEIPEGTRSVGAWAFASCTEIREAILPEGTEEIGDYAFTECYGLRKAEFPSSLRSIGDNAFSSCLQLAEAVLPEGLRHLGGLCFRDCGTLRRIHIPDSLKTMGDNPFCACSALEQVDISDNHPVFEYSDGLLVNREWRILVCHLASRQEERVAVPDSVQVIGNAAFRQDAALKEVLLPSSVTAIGQNAFSHCGSLERVAMAEGLERIGMNAFASCGELKEISLPGSLLEIDYGAFSFCGNLTEADLPAGIRKASGFVYCYNLTLTVHTKEAEDWCRENGIACVRGADPAVGGAGDEAAMLRDSNGTAITVYPETELLSGRSFSLLTEDEAVRQILYRGLPLTAVSRCEINHIPCLALEQEDGSRLVLEELFTVETGKRYLPEESLVLLCEYLMEDGYDYFLMEPEMPEGEKTDAEMAAETEGLRREMASAARQDSARNRCSYGDVADTWSFQGVNPYEGKSHRLVQESFLTGWFDAHGVSWRTGGHRLMQGRDWYVINQAAYGEPEEMYGMAMMREPDREDRYLIPEAGLYAFAAHFRNGRSLYGGTAQPSENFDPAYAEILVVDGLRTEVAYETLSGEEGEPFRARVTLLDYTPADEPVTATWNYQLKEGNTVDELDYTFGRREAVALTGRTTILEAVPSPAAYFSLTLSRGGYREATTALFPVACEQELPVISLRAEDPYYAVRGEPYTVAYTADGKGYGIDSMSLSWEVRMHETGSYEYMNTETPRAPSGQVSLIPTEEMESVCPMLTVSFESGIVYTREGGAYSQVGGTAFEPGIIRLHLDRQELAAGETACLTYEISGLSDFSTLSVYSLLTPAGGSFDDRIYDNYEVEPSATGTIEITPPLEGTLYLDVSITGSNGYYIGAYIPDVPVRADPPEHQ